MRNPILWPALAVLVMLSACAHKSAEPEKTLEQRQANPYSTFSAAVSAIANGNINEILVLRNEPGQSQMAEFLRTLYARYGDVERLHAVAFEREAQVARGVFLAQHKSGPFLWDMIVDGETYTMLRGTNDFSAYLKPVAQDKDALSLAQSSIEYLNEGNPDPVFERLTCNCISPAAFARQVEDLAKRAGKEVSREFIRAETVPGLEGQLQVLHFLSKREGLHLGYHFTMWKVEGMWQINAVNWTQEELLPLPLKNVSKR